MSVLVMNMSAENWNPATPFRDLFNQSGLSTRVSAMTGNAEEGTWEAISKSSMVTWIPVVYDNYGNYVVEENSTLFTSTTARTNNIICTDDSRFHIICAVISTDTDCIPLIFEPQQMVVSAYNTYSTTEVKLSAVRILPSNSTALSTIQKGISGTWSVSPCIDIITNFDLDSPNIQKSITITCTATTPSIYTVTYTTNFYDTVSAYRTPATFAFYVNPEVVYLIDAVTPTYVKLKSYVKRDTLDPVDSSLLLRWIVTPPEALSHVRFLTGNNETPLKFTTDGISIVTAASLIGNVTAQVFNELTGSIQISLSCESVNSLYTDYSIFTPYHELQSNTFLVPVLEEVDVNTPPTKQYKLSVFGHTAATAHNLPPNVGVAFENNSVSEGLVARANLTELYDFYPTELFQSNGSINPLYLDATVDVTTTTPKSCSYSISFSALSATEAGVYYSPVNLITAANFTVLEWTADDYFYPNFGINNESSSTYTLYRMSTASRNITIRNSSIMPDVATIGELWIEFPWGIEVIDYSDFNIPLIKNLTACYTGTQEIGISGWLSAAGWETSAFKVGLPKTITFIDLADWPAASAFVDYPSEYWDELTSEFVPITSISLTPSPSFWGHCHTELFTLLTTESVAGVFNWYVSGISPYPIVTNENSAIVPIPSNTTTQVRPVCLFIFTSALPVTMPHTYYDDNTGLVSAYRNFDSTYSNIVDSTLKGHISAFSFNNQGTIDIIETPNPLAVSADNVYLSGFIGFNPGLPVNLNINGTYTWLISTPCWNASLEETSTEKELYFNIDDTGENLNILKFIPTYINAELDYNTGFNTKGTTTDYCPQIQFNKVMTITAVPVLPAIYTSNRVVLTGEEVLFQNTIPTTLVGRITSIWNQGSVFWSGPANTYSSFITSFNLEGNNAVTLTLQFSGNNGLITETQRSNSIIHSVQSFTPYNTGIVRVIGQTQLQFPYRDDLCRFGPNEWITSDNINLLFTRLQANFTYLDDMSKMYNIPFGEMYGWYGSLSANDGALYNRWRVNIPNLSYKYNDYTEAINNRLTNIKDINVQRIANYGDIIFVSNTTEVVILSSDLVGTEISSIDHKGIGDNFVNIVAIGIDTNNNIYILDQPKNRVIVYSYNFELNRWNQLYDWGGLGGQKAKTKFQNPSDLYIDSDDNIWIADTDNLCVKKFTRTGSWLQTFTSVHFTNTIKPLSVVTGDDGRVHVLTSQYIVAFESDGTFIGIYLPSQLRDKNLIKIEKCQDGGFFYIVTTDLVAKITQIGDYAGEVKCICNKFTNVFHDEHRNILITTPNVIVKYIDRLSILDVKQPFGTYLWPMSSIYVDKNEYNQDWVMNRSFARFWDNLEIFRRSLNGRPSVVDVNGTITPVVKTYTPDEYKDFTHHKQNIFIGINEFTTAPVLNRCFDQLFNCELIILDLIQ